MRGEIIFADGQSLKFDEFGPCEEIWGRLCVEPHRPPHIPLFGLFPALLAQRVMRKQIIERLVSAYWVPFGCVVCGHHSISHDSTCVKCGYRHVRERMEEIRRAMGAALEGATL